MSGTYRFGRVYCQAQGCRRRAVRAVDIELPEDWRPTLGFRVIGVTVGLCVDHGRAVARRAAELLEARGELQDLVLVIDDGVVADSVLRARLVDAERAATFQCRRADGLALALAALRAEDHGDHFPIDEPTAARRTSGAAIQ